MKKIMQRKIEALEKRAAAMEKLLGERKRSIRQLTNEIQGLREMLDIMATYLDIAVSAKGEVHIPMDEVNQYVQCGYDIERGDGTVTLRRKE